jgi:hypothetical protein
MPIFASQHSRPQQPRRRQHGPDNEESGAIMERPEVLNGPLRLAQERCLALGTRLDKLMEDCVEAGDYQLLSLNEALKDSHIALYHFRQLKARYETVTRPTPGDDDDDDVDVAIEDLGPVDFAQLPEYVQAKRRQWTKMHSQRTFPGIDPLSGEFAQSQSQLSEDDDADVVMQQATQTTCPITKQPFREPVRSRVCGHVFEHVAIRQCFSTTNGYDGDGLEVVTAVGGNGERGRRGQRPSIRCPVGGCPHRLTLGDLEPLHDPPSSVPSNTDDEFRLFD